jgi:hypothetical protein
MNGQPGLFPEIEATLKEAERGGFRYREDVISQAEETALAASLDEVEFKPFEFHGYGEPQNGQLCVR